MSCVTFEDCKTSFIDRGGATTKALYDRWAARPALRDAGVIEFVEAFRHKNLLKIDTDAFERIARRENNDALGEMQPSRVKTDPNTYMDDWIADRLTQDVGLGSPWAFVHVLHKYIENAQSKPIPLWEELKISSADPNYAMLRDAYRAEMFLEYFDLVGKTLKVGSASYRAAALESLIDIGINWRIGNMYYSALREAQALVTLRRRFGLNVKYHLLADAVFKADLWCDVDGQELTRVACLFINNQHRKRKTSASEILPKEHFECADFIIERDKERAVYWPLTESTLIALARFFENGEKPTLQP